MSETVNPAPAAGPSHGPAIPTRRALTRSRTDRKVAGVCGGLGAHLGIDPVVLRIVIVVLTLFGGSGLILYAIGWLVIPDEGETRSQIQHILDADAASGPTLAALVAGVVAVVVIGTLIGLGAVFGGSPWAWGWGQGLWPLILAAGIVGAVRYTHRHGPQAFGPTGPGGQSGSPGPYAPPVAPSSAPFEPVGPVAPPPPRPAREESVLGPVTVSLALVAAGSMILLDRIGAWDVHPLPFLAVLLGVVGAGLVVGGFAGRSRGLIGLGVVLTLATALAGTVPTLSARGTGDVTWAPASTASLPAGGYDWAAGNATLDLTSTAIPSDTVVKVSLGAGDVVVLVPPDVQLVVKAHVGLGSLVLPDGIRSDGIGRAVDTTYGALSQPSRGTLTLRLDLGVGTLEVRRAQA